MHQFFTFGDAKVAAAATPAAAQPAAAVTGIAPAGGAPGSGGSSSGVAIEANGTAWPTMLHSPSMEHFRLQGGPGQAPGALGVLGEDEEMGGKGARAPLLPR